MKLLIELNAMMQTGYNPEVKTIPFVLHSIYSGLNEATARAIVFAGVAGYGAGGLALPVKPKRNGGALCKP